MNATQWAGIFAFGGAALLCFCVHRSPWVRIGAIYAGMGLECAVGLRHHLHSIIVHIMGPLYDERAGVQVALIGVVLVIGGALSILFVHRNKSSAPPVVTAATIAAIGLFSIETISLHAVDAMLYKPTGGLLLIGWLWIALALVITFSALHIISQKRDLNK